MIGSILSAGASLIGGLAGGSKKGSGQQVSGFQTLPAEVQDAYLETFLPDVMANYNKPFTPFPMKRAVNPMDDPFASQGAYEWQQYSDQMGGLFSPFGNKPAQAAPAANPDEIPASIKDVLNTLIMGQLKQETDPNYPTKDKNTPEGRYKRSLYDLVNMSQYGGKDDVMKSLDLPKLLAAKPSEYEGNLAKASKTASEALRKYLLSVR